MNYEQTQNALLLLIDSLKPDLDSHELSLLSGLIGAIHSEPLKADNRIAKAVLAIGDAIARTNNTIGFKYGLSLAGKAIRDSKDLSYTNKGNVTVFDCQILDLKELSK